MNLSIVIPVFMSQDLVYETVSQIIEELNDSQLKYEIILVEDGSSDHSWKELVKLKESYPEVIKVIQLIKNYGQHTAIYCGINKSRGDYILTMDDDGQNPPTEIMKLYNKINEGYDLVFAQFAQKKHSLFRRLGSKFINYLNYKMFNKDKSLVLSNFRIFSRSLAQRIVQHKTSHPYIPGLLLTYHTKATNVLTKHKERRIGKSNYTLRRILKLVTRLLINNSNYPLRLIGQIGASVSLSSLIIAIYVLLKAILLGHGVPGFATLAFLISFLGSIIIFMLTIIGKYLIRITEEISQPISYFIREER